jgi:hypothetical protein
MYQTKALPMLCHVVIFVSVLLFIGEGSLIDVKTGVNSFILTNNFRRPSSLLPVQWRGCHNRGMQITRVRMVRNIDMVEALIFYGTNSMFYPPDHNNNNDHDNNNNHNRKRLFLPGVENLIDECKRDETAVLAILDNNNDVMISAEGNSSNDVVIFKAKTSLPPNPRDLWESIHSIVVQPRGFGGSSGFGSKAPDPVRSPLPCHCVVLCDTIDQCRAARYAGMRVLCLSDNSIADGVMNFGDYDNTSTVPRNFWESITIDDIATPGSFWLNPPQPKDDEGNGVDVLSIIEEYDNIVREQQQQQQNDISDSRASAVPIDDVILKNDDPEDKDQYLKDILMDMDPL